MLFFLFGHLVYLHVGHIVQLMSANFIFFIGHHVGYLVHLDVSHNIHLLIGHEVHPHVCQHNVVPMLCEGSDILTEWKSESVTYGRMDGLTEVITSARSL